MGGVVLMSAVLIVHIQPFGGLADIGRENIYQRMMMLIRCFVFPLALLSFGRWPSLASSASQIDRGWFVSVCSTTLWPRSTDFWGWCPLLLMMFNRTVLGLADAVERGRLSSPFSWVTCWRVWQHLACPVSVWVGFVFFHWEPYPWLVAAAQKCPRTDTGADVAHFAINRVVELALCSNRT